MIDSLKDLERDIETFHNNILASNELNDLLQGVIGQARSSAELFEKSSNEMLAKLDVLPDSIGKSVGRQNQMQEEILIDREHWDDEKMFSGLCGMVTSRIYDRVFLEQHGITFDESVLFGEDYLFNLTVYEIGRASCRERV